MDGQSSRRLSHRVLLATTARALKSETLAHLESGLRQVRQFRNPPDTTSPRRGPDCPCGATNRELESSSSILRKRCLSHRLTVESHVFDSAHAAKFPRF